MELLGEAFPSIAQFAVADGEWEESVGSMQDTVLEFDRLIREGKVSDLSREYLQVELVSMEAKAQQLQEATRSLTERLRLIYGLRVEGYGK